MRSAFFTKLSLLLLFMVAAVHCQPPGQQVNPHTQIRWPANCNNTPGMIYNYASNTCVESGHQIEVTWDTTQPDLANNYVACMGTNGVHRCPVNAPAWNGIQIGNGPGSGVPTSSLAVNGRALCQFDGVNLTVGDFVQVSGITAGTCHDTGSTTAPTNAVPIIGQILTVASPSSMTALVLLASTGGTGPMGPAGPPGGSLSYPGVVSDNNNGLNVSGNVTATDLMGYRQNPYNARSRNRDEILEITVTPQDMPGCAQAGMGNIDDRPCFTQAMQYLATTVTNERVIKKLIVPYTREGYIFRSPGAMVQLPFDFGDYHSAASFASGAAVAPYFVNGALTGCAVSGGAGYAPNAHLPVHIFDPSLQGTGAYATVLTNATGTPGATCEPASIIPGMGYPTTGVNATLVPLGGDGAAGTCALSSNTFAATCTITAGGSGYQTGGLVAKMAGLTCTTYPALTITTASAAVTGVTSTAGAGCTYTGSATATVPIQFGASCGGTQCTLMTPEVPLYQPCAVNLVSGVTIEGIGNPTISTGWDAGTVNSSQMIAFCDATGSQGSYITMRNLTIRNTFIGYYFPFEVFDLRLDNIIYSGVALEGYAFSFNGSFYYGYNPIRPDNAPTPAPPSKFTNIQSNADGGWMCGGAWAGRNVLVSGSGAGVWLYLYNAMGVYTWAGVNNTLGHSGSVNDQFGHCFNLIVEGHSRYPGGVPVAATVLAVDKYIEANIWKSQNGPASPLPLTGALSNGLTSCVLLTGLPLVDRTVDYNWGYRSAAGGANSSTYPYSQCYPGAMYSSFLFLPRYSQAETVGAPNTNVFTDIFALQTFRPIIGGRFQSLTVNRVYSAAAGGSYADPYTQAGQTVGAINANDETGVQLKAEDVNAPVFSSGVTTTALNILLFGNPATLPSITKNVNGFANNPNITLGALSASLGGSALAAGACASTATTITGATTAMAARSSPTTYPGDGYTWQSYISAANTVTTKLCAIVAGTPTASTYQIRVTP